ncbi:TOMM precursor leader peptide-binding protein [Oscillatoria salina]|uniref:TOMM precursor leader peptide-binding protein n=1 Tax=Oscillatoria salina TaxID=331517 RepID=UPI001CC9D5AF|nr:TOMM precursor leader peptide-binding protein [Oscillatoria salina]MBZ8183175.1 TOMM precursor leader peptide-binding protein [Oscillatoria salina IIICB1]
MIQQPRFKHCFHVEVVEPEGVFLLWEQDPIFLTGQIYKNLAPLLDGSRTVEELVNLLADKVSAPEVYYALMRLEQQGYIVDDKGNLPPETNAFWESLPLDDRRGAYLPPTGEIAVTTFGNIPTHLFVSSLEALHLQVNQQGKYQVVLTDDYLRDELASFNQKSLQLQQPWMLVKPLGTVVWIGPIFHPGKTGCWECLAQRLRANRFVDAFIQQRKKKSSFFPTSKAALPSTLQIAFGLAATEVAKWIAQAESQQLEGGVVTLNLKSLEMVFHQLVPRPQCCSCGQPQLSDPTRPPLPINLQSRSKAFVEDGGYRSLTPEETLARYGHHLSSITGVVRNLDRLSHPTHYRNHTYIAGHNFGLMFDDLYFLRQTVRGRSGGKGKTADQAKASGLCEAIERYSGTFQGDEIRIRATYQDLGETAIHPHTCLNFSAKQYQNRHLWNADCPPHQKIPEPFDTSRIIDWTPIWSLTDRTFKYLPTAYCYYGYPRSESPDCWADSNGAAAGNNIEEAILQGFMELVERDSVCLWWYNRLLRPGVNLASFDDPYILGLQKYYRTIERLIWVLDLTSDFGIPTFVAISSTLNKKVSQLLFGFGAHFDAKIAITRALTEVNQALTPILVAREVNSSLNNNESDRLTIEDCPYFLPHPTLAEKISADYPQFWHEDLLDDVLTCQKIVENRGMSMLVLDQTRPDLNLNVVKVIVPGMRHYWRRLAPGRLYKVPVQLGWLSEPLTEEQLNPQSIF